MNTHYWLPTKPETDTDRVGFRKVAAGDLTQNEMRYVLESQMIDRKDEESHLKVRVLARKYLWK